MSQSLGRLVLDMAANAAGFERDMQRISKSSQRELNKVSRQLRFAQRDLDQARARVTRLAGAMTALGGIALGATVREFRKLSQEADRIQKLGIQTGLTAEAIQELSFAAEQAGSNQEAFTRGVIMMQRNVQNANDGLSTQVRSFERMGVQIEQLRGLSADQQFALIADAISNMTDETQRNASALEVFGRSATDIIPLLAQGSAGIEGFREQMRATGAVMSQDMVDDVAQFNDAMNVLSKRLQAVKVQLFSDLIGPLSEFADWLANTEEGQRVFNDTLERLGTTARNVGIVIASLFTANLVAAIGTMIVAEVRVARLTAAKLGLQGATMRASAAVAIFGRTVSIATGPVGIIAAVLGTLWVGYRNVKDIAEEAGVSMENFGRGAETTAERVARLSGNMEKLNEIQRRNRFEELRNEALELKRAIIEIDREIEKRRQEEQSSGFLDPFLDDIRSEREGMLSELNLIVDGLHEIKSAGNEAGKGLGDVGDGAEEATKEMKKAAEEGARFVAQMEDLQDALTGGNARAFRDYSRSIAEATQLFQSGRISIGDYGAAVHLLTRELADAQEETEDLLEWLESLEDKFLAGPRMIDDYADAMTRAAAAMIEAATGMRIMGDESEGLEQRLMDPQSNLARSLSHALASIDGRPLVDSIAAAFRAAGTQTIGAELEDIFRDALESAIGDSEFLEKNIGGFMVAMSEAMDGNAGAALGTAIGQAVAGPIGAVLGNTLGGFFDSLFGSRPPRFDLAGDQARGPGFMATNPDFFDTALGGVHANFRRMDPEDEAALVGTIRQFDKSLAVAAGVRADEAAAAVQRWAHESRFDGEDMEAMLTSRLEAAVTEMFDGFVSAMIMAGHDLEDRIQRMMSVQSIDRELTFGRGLGLTGAGVDLVAPTRPQPGAGTGPDVGGIFGDVIADAIRDVDAFNRAIQGTGDAADVTNPALAHTLQVIDDLSRPTETLAETFSRLQSVTGALDTAYALLGRQFDGSREDLIRFGDDLSAVFGDDMEALVGGLNRIFNTFFTDAERAEVAANSARQRAADMLQALGVAVDDSMFTVEGFREVWDDLFDSLGPEQQALLIEAGVAIADLVDLEQQLADERRRQADELQSLMDTVDMAFLEAMAPARASLQKLVDRWADMEEQATDLGASEDQLSRVRRAARAEMSRWISDMRLSTLELADDFFSVEQSFSQVGMSMSNTMDNMRDKALRALGSIDDWLMRSQLDSISPLTPTERLGEAESQFRSAFDAAMAGDFDALADLPGLADMFLGEAGGFFGTSTDQFRSLWDEVQAMMNEAADIEPPPEMKPANAAQMNTLIETNSRFGSQIEELNREMQAWKLADQIKAMAEATERTPAEMAAHLGFTNADMRQILMALGQDIPTGTELSLRDHFNEVVGELAEQNPLIKAMESTNDSLATTITNMTGILERNLWAIGDVLVQILQELGGTFKHPDSMESFAKGGPIRSDGPAIVHSGEYVVPRGGALVSEGGNTEDMSDIKRELHRISTLVERGNTDRRDGLGAVVREEQSTRRTLDARKQTVRAA